MKEEKMENSTVLDSFTQLGSNLETARVNAGVRLLKHLTTRNENIEQTYALNRLIRGTASARKNARFGFYSVLVAYLRNTKSIQAETVLESIKKHLSIDDNYSKSEIGNIYLGQILTCGALIHSDLLFNSKVEQEWKQVLEMLFAAGRKRSYLTLIAHTFVLEFLRKLNLQQFESLWSVIKREVSKPWPEQTLDTIHLLYFIRTNFSSVVKKKFVRNTLDVTDVLNSDAFKPLCNLLLNSPGNVKLGHPFYAYLGTELASCKFLSEWCTELDEQLSKPNRNKLSIILDIMTSLITNLTNENSTLIPKLLIKQLIISSLQTLKTKHAPEQALKFYKALMNRLVDGNVETGTKLQVIRELLFDFGNFSFERIVKERFIQRISSGLDSEGVKQLSSWYEDVIEGSKGQWTNSDRVQAVQMYVKLLSLHAVQTEHEWRLDCLKFLFRLGLGKNSGTISSELTVVLKDAFYRALDQKLPKLEDLRNLLSSLIHHIDSTIVKENNLRIPFTSNSDSNSNSDSDSLQHWNETLQLISKLEGKKQLSYVPVFHTLLLHMGLQLFKDPELAGTSLRELRSCYDRIKRKTKPEQNQSEPIWIEVIVDLFLNLLSHNSHLFRNVIGCVFPHLCSKLNPESIRQILDVLDPKNDLSVLFTRNENESESEDESEVEIENRNESSDEDNEEDDKQIDKLRIAVRNVLHKSGYQTDDESEDLDNIDESEGQKLNEALSEVFRNLKPNRNSKKPNKKQNKNEKTLTHFRIRVLDLIDLYIESESESKPERESGPELATCLEIITVLLQTLEFSLNDSHQKPLEQRVRNTLKKLTTKTFRNNITETILLEFVNSLLNRNTNSFVYQELIDVISDCCTFVLISSDRTGQMNKITNQFREYLTTFFQKRDCLLPFNLFRNLLKTNWTGIWDLVPVVIVYGFDSDLRPFRRNQALELLNAFYGNKRFHNTDSFSDKIVPVNQELKERIFQVFSKPEQLKDKYLIHLLQLLITIKSNEFEFDWNGIGNSVRSYHSSITFTKELRIVFNKFCRLLNISSAVMEVKRREIVQQNGTANSVPICGKKRKKSENKLKTSENFLQMKRRKEEERLEISSKGLDTNIDFSQSDFTNRKKQRRSENVEIKSKKKKLKTNL